MATAASHAAASLPAPAPAPGVAALPVAQRGLLTFAVMLATLMQILDSTIANVALPHMQSTLGATADSITWVLTSYIVASAIAIPVTGWLADRVGSRNLFIGSVAGFIAASALCGMAVSLPEMILFRVFQGVSAAFMNPLSQTALLDINPPERHAKAMAIWGMGVMVGPILGPVLGGWLTENYDWRWVFYINLPIGVICLVLMWRLLPSRPIRRRSFDGFGFALLALGIAALQLLLDRGQGEDWFHSEEIWIEAILALVALWMFGVHMAMGKRPMFDRDLFANRNLVTALFFMIVIGIVMMATMALLPPMLQRLYGYPVLDTGMLLMPRGFGIILSMFISSQLIQRGADPRLLVGTGLMLIALSLWQMTQWTLVMDQWPFIESGMLQGLGMGLVFAPLNGMAFATLPAKYRTDGSSLLNLFRNIGASVGISAVTTALARNGQVSHADLSQHITAQALGVIDPDQFQALGSAGDTVMAMIDAEVNRQAAMIAYLNDFRMMMIVTLCAVPLVLLLKRPAKIEKADPAAMGH